MQGKHQIRPQALAERLVDQRCFELRHLGVAAALQVGLDRLFENREAELVQACALGHGIRHISDVG
jgi:hypothetical protein